MGKEVTLCDRVNYGRYLNEQPGSLRTTNGYVTLSSREKVRTEDKVTYTDVKPDALIINCIDAKTNKQI